MDEGDKGTPAGAKEWHPDVKETVDLDPASPHYGYVKDKEVAIDAYNMASSGVEDKSGDLARYLADKEEGYNYEYMAGIVTGQKSSDDAEEQFRVERETQEAQAEIKKEKTEKEA